MNTREKSSLFDRVLFEPWRRFFFVEEAPLGLALVRITLPLILFYDLLGRWFFARELYSADGAPAPLWATYGFRNPLPELPGAVAVALFTILLAALLTASAGWMTRVSLAVATVLYAYFNMLDSVSTITKYTVIANHVLLLLALSQCGAVWSFDAWRKRTSLDGPDETGPPPATLWPRRLVQLFIAIVYMGAAMTKFHTPAYFNGDQMMWWMLTQVNSPHPVGEWLANHPTILVIGAYASLVWEIVFLFLVWKGIKKYLVLAVGVGFHISTYFTLGLDIFPLVMIATYFAFLDEAEIRKVVGGVQGILRKIGIGAFRLENRPVMARFAPMLRRLGPVAFGLFVWSAALGGAGLERVMDPYNVRGGDGPMPLEKIDPERATKLLSEPEPLRMKDMLFALEMGTDFFGDIVVNRGTEYSHGQMLIAQCHTAPPHPDLYVECNLFTADGEIIDRRGKVLSRTINRLSFSFPLTESLSAGKYELVLRFSGTTVARRSFTLVE